MSDDESILGDALCDLTIELDDGIVDSACTPHSPPSSSHLIPSIGAPRRPSDVVIFVDESIVVHSLSSEAKAMVVNQMQLPGYSSMKNSDALGAAMGFGQDELMSQSRQGGIIYSLMTRIANRPLNDLLKALVTISRVDTLSSLRPYLLQMRNGPPSKPTHNRYFDSIDFSSSTSFIPPSSADLLRVIEDRRKFFLLVHYEKDKKERSTFKHFLKNVKAKGEEMEVEIVDVKNTLNGDEHVMRRLQQLYSAAHFVIVCVSESYRELIGQKIRVDQMEDMIANIHDWIMGEHMSTGQQNRRFRIVVMGDCDQSVLPFGWSASFLWYRFPSNWVDFVNRTFLV